MNARRTWLSVVGASLLAAPLAGLAQRPARMPTVGFLISETPAGQESRLEALRAGLRERGYVEGKNIAIEMRSAIGQYEQLPKLADELVRLRVDVLVAFGSKAARAARSASTTIPDRKSTRLNSSHPRLSRMPSSA